MTERQIEDDLSDVSRQFYAWAGLMIFILGTVGNLFDLILFLRLESLNTLASSLFLLASFIGSQCVMLTATLGRLVFGMTGFDPLFSSLFLCKARWMIGPASGAFALTCVAFAAFDRLLLVRNDYRVQMTLNQARVIIVLVALFWLSFFSLYAVFFTSPTASSCRLVDPLLVQLMPVISLFVYSVIPIGVLSLLCALIWKRLGRWPGRSRHDQVTRMIISQIAVIIVTSLPSAIYAVYTLCTRTTWKSHSRLAVENLVNTVCILIGFLTHAVMFYVYLFASVQFRRNVQLTFKECCQRTRRIAPTGE
jgi:hypothetical protein